MTEDDNMQVTPELEKLWEDTKKALGKALSAGYIICTAQGKDNVYIPEWFVSIAESLTAAKAAGVVYKQEEK